MQADCCVCICNFVLFTFRNLSSLQQEVKECAITCMGLVISTFGDQLRAELPSCLPVLVDRMGNEITRLTAVKVVLVLLLKAFILKFLLAHVCDCVGASRHLQSLPLLRFTLIYHVSWTI